MLTRLTVAAGFAAVALGLSVVAADRAYHSTHIPVLPTGDAPLRRGFVENIHTNGEVVYAREVYMLNGATPNATYQVILVVHLGDPECTNAPSLAIPAAILSTNSSGNGTASLTIPLELAAGLAGTHGVLWQFVDTGGDVVYRTACSEVVLD